jgi:hypothetical protein
LSAAGGAIALGSAMVLGGLAIATSAEGTIAILGASLALAGVPTAGLATWYLATRRELDVRVRAAYLVAVVALGLGAIAGDSTIVLGNSASSNHRVRSRDGQRHGKPGASAHAKAAMATPCTHALRRFNLQFDYNNRRDRQ